MRNSQFSSYEIYFYGTGFGSSPQHIISQKNNKELLGACVLPKTKQQLNKLGIPVSDIQVALLQKWRLLKLQDELLQTSFSILNQDQISRLRNYAKSLAPEIVKAINQELSDFLQVLHNQPKISPYLLFFTCVADGLVWDYFTEEGVMPDMTIKGEEDLWIGVLWGSYSPRAFFLGTNSYPVEDGEVKFVWNNDLLPKLKPFFLHQKRIPQMINKLSIPVICQKPGDPVYESSLKLSTRLTQEILRKLDLPALVEQYQFRDEQEALIIVYHELMWSLLEEMENKGLLIKPSIIANPNQKQDFDITNLIFKVITN